MFMLVGCTVGLELRMKNEKLRMLDVDLNVDNITLQLGVNV